MDLNIFYPTNISEWRQWLELNHQSKNHIWLKYFKKATEIPTISWSEAVDQAICYGWIDSTRKSIDEASSIQYFTKRKSTSVWSKINKEKVERLIADGLMSQAGLDTIEIAKQNGSWTILDSVEDLIIPYDLETAFEKYPGVKDFFLSLSKTDKKMALYRLVLAKQEATRQKRILEIVEKAIKESN